VGGEGSGFLAVELARRQVPVLLTTDLEDPDEWDPESEEELSPAAARERDRLLPIYETAARLEEAGVAFALTSGGTGGSGALDGVRRYVEHGLSEEGALEALTLTPARLLGVPELGRLQEGAPANLIVTDRSLLEEGVHVVWSFVNGVAEKGDEPRTEAELDDPDVDPDLDQVVGRWQGTLDVGGQAMPVALEIRETAGRLTGTAQSVQMGTTNLQNVELDGGRLRFQIPVPQMEGSVRFEAIVRDDRMRGTGTFRGPTGDVPFPFELTRAPGGGR